MKTSVRNKSVGTLLLMLAMICGHALAMPQSITTPNSGRPMAEAVKKLEGIYNLPINYEDSLYMHESETFTGQTGLLELKRKDPITFTYEAPPDAATPEVRKALALKAIENALHSYNATRGTEGWFTVIETEKGFDVVASQFVDSSGSAKQLDRLLSTPVTIASRERTVKEFMKEIANSLSAASGKKIVVGAVPMPLFAQYKTNLGIEGESAEDALNRLFAETPVGYVPRKMNGGVAEREARIKSTLSWKLYCVPPDGNLECAINISIVAPENAATVGMRPSLPAIEK